MNPAVNIGGLVVHYRNGPSRREEEVARVLTRLFEPILLGISDDESAPLARQTVADPEAVADKLARILFDNSRAAATGTPDPKTLIGLRSRLLEFVQKGMPVEAQMLWSPKKHWILGNESGVDVAELLAFQTLISIISAVRSVFPAGMSLVIDLEDLEFQFMEGQTEDVIKAQDLYISGLICILETLGLNEIVSLRRISDHARNGEELDQWRKQMEENYRALEAYWYESEARPISSWETLPSFKRIRELGWKGPIPPEMRRYYLGFLGPIVDRSDVEKVKMVLRNLATILLHYQAGLLRGSGKVQPIKLSFVRSAAGAPASLQEGRVDIRFAPRRLCSRVSAAAPWSTKGFLCGRGNDMRVAFRGWREVAGARHRFEEGWVTISGGDTSAKIRADYMVEEG